MKKYYLIAEKNSETLTTIRVSDALGNGRVCLMEFDAPSFSEAVKMFSFSATGCGKTAICGVAKNGKPYAEVLD